MKILALNLPQFHTIPENDEWWGKGFTEWINVKKAKPLYKEHIQPRIPMGGNYYDLSKVDDIKWQTEIAKQYGVDGFIYYHYWFNGKLLLEKPLEILLENKDIDIEYCFCWANESWARTWDGKDTDILMEQKYGGKNDWENHIHYLMPFFKDSRYIKKNGRPILYIYSASRFPNFDEMIEFWNEYVKRNGFPGLYIVEFINTVNPSAYSKYSEAVCEFEPHSTCRFDISNFLKIKRFLCKRFGLTDYMYYDYVWKKILTKSTLYGNREIIRSCFTNFDNSPRKGKHGLVFKGASPEKFGKYLSELVNSKRQNLSADYLIINAWNEWGEGAILEPTDDCEYKYLEAVKKVSDFLQK